MDFATFLVFQHVSMDGPAAIDEEDATNDDGSLNANYISAVFNSIDRGGDVALFRGLHDPLSAGGLPRYHWPDIDHTHEFECGMDEGESILACWQARRGGHVAGHVWAYHARGEIDSQ